ncbi:MAG TPA: citrate synthase [Polyangiaceae bacterium]|jgi:citrate synthase
MVDGTRARSGLEGVVVADTKLSDVDGERGRLVIAGHDVEELARTAGFERVCGLLWGIGPDEAKERVGTGRTRAFEVLPRLGDALGKPAGMDALRASLAHLVDGGEGAGDAAALTGAAAVFAAAWLRAREDRPPIPPDPSHGHAEDFLRMGLGVSPRPEHAGALDAYLATVSDHGMNASTFAARVVASTGSDMVSSVVAAVGALKGPLHGGAPGPVLDMLDSVGMPSRAAAWVDAELDAGRRIMGMGHRVYRVRDPRAAVFEKQIEALAAASAGRAGERLALARAVEHAAEEALARRHPDRPLKANVEFFTAVLLEAVGLPREAFSPTFAVGRVAGWCAHWIEQRATGRLIRPASRYVGPPAA